jgi:3-dehydroquinate synthetase
MLAEARWAVAEKGCETTLPGRLKACMQRLEMPTSAPMLSMEQLIVASSADKKLSRGTLSTAILEDVGRVRLEQIPESEIRAMMAQLEF